MISYCRINNIFDMIRSATSVASREYFISPSVGVMVEANDGVDDDVVVVVVVVS
jgi:hypothetical protein